jgi:type VI secretion system protein ImpK
MDLAGRSPHAETLPDVCADLLALIVYLRKSKDFGQRDVLHDRFVSLFSAMEEKARELDIADVDVQDAKYALVGFIDETVGWASRLEQEYFSRNVAGEEFFDRLEEIKEVEGRREVLKVYYLCLTLGFDGKYFRNPGRLREHIEELQKILDLKSVESFSPHGGIPKETSRRRRSGIPAWLPWVLMAAGVVILGTVLISLKIGISDWATGIISRM